MQKKSQGEVRCKMSQMQKNQVQKMTEMQRIE